MMANYFNHKLKHLPGARFGRWVIVSRDGPAPGKQGTALVTVICDCGVIKHHVYLGNLTSGRSTQCAACGYRGRSKRIHHNGETLTVAELARRIGIRSGTLRRRLHKGVPMKRAVKRARMPSGIGRAAKQHVVGGISRTIKEWNEIAGISRAAFYLRLSEGWTFEAALTTSNANKSRS